MENSKKIITYDNHNDLQPAMNIIGIDNILPNGHTLGIPNFQYETQSTFQFETKNEIHAWYKPKRLLNL